MALQYVFNVFTGTFDLTDSSSAPVTPVSVIANDPTSSITGGFTDIAGWTQVEDTDAAFDPVTGIFIAPRSALYQIECSLFAGLSAATVNQVVDLTINLNGTLINLDRTVLSTAQGSTGFDIMATIRLVATDQITIQVLSTNGGAGFTGGATFNYLSIYSID